MGGFAVHLGILARADVINVAAQPDTADGEATVAVTLWDAGFLQKFQSPAAGADENEFGGDLGTGIGRDVMNFHQPTSASVTLQPRHLVLIANGDTGLRRQMLAQQPRQRAVVDIRAGDLRVRRKGLFVAAPLHQQGRPGGNGGAILAVFHAMIAMMRRHLLMAGAQKIRILFAPDEAHMRASIQLRGSDTCVCKKRQMISR
jgi:hypothetical protein